MNKLRVRLPALIARVEDVMNFVGAALIMVLMFLTTADILLRKFFKPITGAYEISEVLLVAVVVLAMGYTQREEGNVGMDMLVSRFKAGPRHVVEIITLLLSLAVFTVIGIKGGEAAYRAFTMHEVPSMALAMPLWPAKMLIPIGAFVLCLRFVIQIAERITTVKGGLPEAKENLD